MKLRAPNWHQKSAPKKWNTAAPTTVDRPLISQLALSPHQLHLQTKNRPSPQPTAQKTRKQSPAHPLLTALNPPVTNYLKMPFI